MLIHTPCENRGCLEKRHNSIDCDSEARLGGVLRSPFSALPAASTPGAHGFGKSLHTSCRNKAEGLSALPKVDQVEGED